VELKHLNTVRLHLKVATVADVATADGGFIQDDYYTRRQHSSQTSRWSRQPVTTEYQIGLWQKACRLTLLQTAHVSPRSRITTRLKTSLGRWTVERNQHWSTYYDPMRECLITHAQGKSGRLHYASQMSGRNKQFKQRFSGEYESRIGRRHWLITPMCPGRRRTDGELGFHLCAICPQSPCKTFLDR
jgi:hypothetical protein